MAKRTAVIDIGSNSARLVIFEKSSHYGFHLICEQKSKVRIGEGAYEKGGRLQSTGIERAFLALRSFLYAIQKYRVRKTICVATSALRDAPNGKAFVRWIKKRAWAGYQDYRWEAGGTLWCHSGEQSASTL